MKLMVYFKAWTWPQSHITGPISCMGVRHLWRPGQAGWLWLACHFSCMSIQHRTGIQQTQTLTRNSATATKTNWITLVTGVSHERLQVFHRWIAYAFFVLALLHTFPFIVYHVHWHDMEMQFEMGLIFYWTGIVALIFQAWLTFASHSTIRSVPVGRRWMMITNGND